MAPLRTPLCERLGVEHPIIQAALGGATCPALAAAVSNAGALGMLVLTAADLDTVRQQVRETRALTRRPFAVNLNLRKPQDERVDICLEEGVRVISFFWCDPTRELIERVHAAKATVLHTIDSAASARRVVDLGVDIVVAQGWEAGGHVRGEVATLPLVPAVVDAVAPVPVVAAGGIADGRGLAAVLMLGAAGAWIGTRFLASEEAAIHPRYRELILSASETDTAFTELFDGGWPDAPHRVIRNKTFDAWEAAGSPATGNRPGEGQVIGRTPAGKEVLRYQSYTPGAAAEGDIDAMSLWAGQSVGIVKKVQPAAAIVKEIVEEARSALSGKRRGKALRGGVGVDNKLESNQRMVWIEQGGLDLREAMAKRRRVTRQRSR